MRGTTRWATRLASIALMTAALGAVAAGPPRRAVPHGGGGHSRSAARAHVAARSSSTAPRGQVPAGGTANGVARWGYGGYGYGSGYGYGYGYGGYWGSPCWGGWSPYWSVGWYGGWGWPYYGWGPYGGWYGPYYDGPYVVALPAPDPTTPATVLTKLAPSKAEVMVDGVSVGYAKDYTGRWDSLHLAPGKHTITFRSPGYTTSVIDLEALPAAHYVFSDDLVRGDGETRHVLPAPTPPAATASAAAEVPAFVPAPALSSVARGRLKVRAQPEDAAVYLDGEYLGLAGELARLHGAIPVATGQHRLEAVRPGYVSAASTIEVSGDAVAEAEITLVRAP